MRMHRDLLKQQRLSQRYAQRKRQEPTNYTAHLQAQIISDEPVVNNNQVQSNRPNAGENINIRVKNVDPIQELDLITTEQLHINNIDSGISDSN